MTTRREFLGRGAVGLAMAVGVGVPLVGAGSGGAAGGRQLRSDRPLPAAFQVPLPVPVTLRPAWSEGTHDHYEIVQQERVVEVLPGTWTRVWGYGGTFPGPTIESRRGRTVSVRHTNHLPVPTVTHLHGARTPAASDGFPTDLLLPVTSGAEADGHGTTAGDGRVRSGARRYDYPLDQRAGTFWYHDHRMDFTGPAVWRGLAGFHLHRDAVEDALRLPSGRHELPLLLADRAFDADGNFRYPSLDPTLLHRGGVAAPYAGGVLGDVMLVNGAPWPLARVDAATYRLRVLNACNARRLDLRLEPRTPGALVQIGSDGGLLASPIAHDHLVVAPAERFDVLVDFTRYRPGTRLTLVDDFGAGRMHDVVRFVVGHDRFPRYEPPDRLSELPALTASDAHVVRTLRFRRGSGTGPHGWLIGDRPFRPEGVAFTARLGTTEVWHVSADFHHPVHVHLASFQVLGRGTGGPRASDHGWKDTVDLPAAEQATLAVRFSGHAGRYVLHCHNLEHEDTGMMATFATTTA